MPSTRSSGSTPDDRTFHAGFRFNIQLSDMPATEEFLAREFRRRYHHHDTLVPDPSNTVEWFAIMQHHGTPTRLLDWTYSARVALYFACEKSEGRDGAIWRINAKWALQASYRATAWSAKERQVSHGSHGKVDESDMNKLSKLLMRTKRKPFAYPLTPFRLNPRLSVQQGTFLWCGDITRPFADNLAAMKGHDRADNVCVLQIPRALKAPALQHLYRSNITHASLFPGLDGFARALGISWLAARPEWVDWPPP